jgi:hypothetical protein
MGMAGVDVAPGIEDADDRATGNGIEVVTDLQQSGPMPEAAQILCRNPTLAAQLIHRLPRHF